MSYIPMALRPLSSYQRDEMEDLKRRLLKLETKEIPLTASVMALGDILIGTSTALSGVWGTGQLQITDTATNHLLLNMDVNSGTAASLEFLKRRSGWTVLNSGDVLGAIGFSGADGVDAALGAYIYATVNGTPGSNVMPTRLGFFTSPVGSSTPVERLRLNDTGGTVYGKLDISGSGEGLVANHSGAQSIKLVGGGAASTGIGWRSYLLGANVTLPADNIPEVVGGGGYDRGYAIGMSIENSTDKGMTFWSGSAAGDMTERMRMTNGGSFGIGISPSSKLHVHGGAGTYLKVSTTTFTNGIDIGFDGAAAYLWNYGNCDLIIGANNVERMRVKSTGLVGIGISSPITLFHVHGAPGTYIRVSTTSFTTGMDIGFDGAGAYIWNYHATYMTFGTNNAFTMVLQSNQRMGLGILSPVSRLDVLGTITVSASDSAYTTAGWGRSLQQGSGYVLAWSKGGGSYSHGIGGTNGGLYFMRSTADDHTASALYDMIIADDGKVFIRAGTSTELAVVGGMLYVNYTATTFNNGSEADAYTYTILANTLSKDGESLWVEVFGRVPGGTTPDPRYRLYINGVLIGDTTPIVFTSGFGGFYGRARIIRTGATTGAAVGIVFGDEAENYTSPREDKDWNTRSNDGSISIDWSTNIVVKLTVLGVLYGRGFLVGYDGYTT
jgi:hypothetical protein